MGLIAIAAACWLLLGGLPRVRSDAAAGFGRTRSHARGRLVAHSRDARAAKRRKHAEWYAWLGAAAVMETGGVLAYLTRSAWHGWGDHRRAAAAGWRGRAARRAALAGDAGPEDDSGAGTAGPEAGTAPVPPEPPAGGGQPVPDGTAPQTGTAESPPSAPTGEGGTVHPLRPVPPRPAAAPAASPRGRNMTMPDVAEAPDLETAVRYAGELIAAYTREADAAQADLTAAEADRASVENYSAGLATAGISGPLMDALVAGSDAVEARVTAAHARIAAADAALAAARAARASLRRHEDAADQLAATGGAAARTDWYGASAASGA